MCKNWATAAKDLVITKSAGTHSNETAITMDTSISAIRKSILQEFIATLPKDTRTLPRLKEGSYIQLISHT